MRFYTAVEGHQSLAFLLFAAIQIKAIVAAKRVALMFAQTKAWGIKWNFKMKKINRKKGKATSTSARVHRTFVHLSLWNSAHVSLRALTRGILMASLGLGTLSSAARGPSHSMTVSLMAFSSWLCYYFPNEAFLDCPPPPMPCLLSLRRPQPG